MANSYPIPRRRFAIAAKEESVYGTPETIDFGADAFRLIEVPEVQLSAAQENVRDEWVTGGLGGLINAPASGKLVQISGKAPFIGPGVAYSASVTPSIHELLVTAFSAAVDVTGGSEKWDYDISDAPATGLTVHVAKAGKLYEVTGAVLSELSIEMVAGKWPEWNFTLMGIYTDHTEADLPSATYLSELPPIMEASALTIGAYSPVWRSATLDLGLEVALRGDGNATDAHQGYRIVRRAPTLKITLEADDLANYDPWGDFYAGTARAVTFRCGGAPVAGNQYNRFNVDIAETSVKENPANPDLDGLDGLEVTYGVFTPSSGNQLRITAD